MSSTVLDARCPGGPLADAWSKHKFDLKLVNPSNRRKFKILVGNLSFPIAVLSGMVD